jgi:hypothetical protein
LKIFPRPAQRMDQLSANLTMLIATNFLPPILAESITEHSCPL